jgi:hypothetical protein
MAKAAVGEAGASPIDEADALFTELSTLADRLEAAGRRSHDCPFGPPLAAAAITCEDAASALALGLEIAEGPLYVALSAPGRRDAARPRLLRN